MLKCELKERKVIKDHKWLSYDDLINESFRGHNCNTDEKEEEIQDQKEEDSSNNVLFAVTGMAIISLVAYGIYKFRK